VAKLTDDEKRAIIGARLSKTLDGTDSELRSDRQNALNFYFGRPLGTEIDGRAQVVTKDIMDVIEWMMPSLIRILGTKDSIQFDPVGPEDEQQAKQESLYIQHVVWKKNPGFMLMYNWIKDCLMQKVGYAHYWWEKGEKVEFDCYEGLDEEQLVVTLNSLAETGEVKVMESDQDDNGRWSIKVRITKSYGCPKWEVFPPDEVIVDKDCRGDIKKAKAVFHLRRNVTRSELLEMGYDKKRVGELTSYTWRETTEERRARDTVNETDEGDDEGGAQWATKELTLMGCWTYLDADDDGIAELRYLLLAGNDILEDEECPEIPWESLTPIPVPHRHVGLSVYDILEDMQRINTALNRGLLDNTYFTQNPRVAFNKRTVDHKMLGVNRPGGHVAVDGPPGAGDLFPIPVQPMQDRILPVIQYFSEVRENRAGVGRMTAGLDADTLARSTKGAYINAQTTSSQRIEMIARILGETGISSLYASMHRLSMRHQDWMTHEKLAGEWVAINPTEWKERANMTVSVGLGASNKEELKTNLQVMATAQSQAAQVPGLIQPKNVYALFREMQTVLGFESKSFVTDPDSPEYEKWQAKQTPPPDPYVEVEKMKAQMRMMEKQLDAMVKTRQMGTDAGIRIAELELQHERDLAAPGIGAELSVGPGRGAPSPARNGAAQ
jgi:hypothetical protein